MATERCVVTSVHSDWVGIQPLAGGSGCGACAQRKGCGQGLWSQLLGGGAQREMRARVASASLGSLQIGDTVEVDLADSALLQAALIAYGLPVAGLMSGLAVGSMMGLAAVGAGLGLLLGGLVGRRWVSGQGSTHFEPEVTARVTMAVARDQGAFAP